jgi:hypothetical protein
MGRRSFWVRGGSPQEGDMSCGQSCLEARASLGADQAGVSITHTPARQTVPTRANG